MENKKDIGNAFKEKLDGLQKSPNDALWNSISTSLDEKMPTPHNTIWKKAAFFFAGATLLLGILSYFLWHDQQPAPVQQSPALPATDSPTDNAIIHNGPATTINTIDFDNPETKRRHTLVNDKTSGRATYKSSIPTRAGDNQEAKKPLDTSDKTHTAQAYADKKNKQDINSADSNEPGKIVPKKRTGNGTGNPSALVQATDTSASATAPNGSATTAQQGNNTEAIKNNLYSKTPHIATKSIDKSDTGSTEKTSATENAITGNTTIIQDTSANSDDRNMVGGTKSLDAMIHNATDIPNSDIDEIDTGAGSYDNNSIPVKTTFSGNVPEEGNNSSNTLALTEKQPDSPDNNLVSDSLSIAATADKDSIATGDKTQNNAMAATGKFYVAAHLGPIYYKNPPDMSALVDPRLSSINTESEITISYGLNIGYNLNNKWSLRAGAILRKMELSAQHTMTSEPIVYIPITYGQSVITTSNFSGIKYEHGVTNNAVINTLHDNQTNSTMVKLVNKFSFIEIPVEAVYHIFGNKTGIYLSGGISTLFLTENKFFAQNSKGSILMGSSKNINNISFSASLGLGFYYELLEELKINLEPMAKYYFNSQIFKQAYSIQAGLQYNFDIWNKKE